MLATGSASVFRCLFLGLWDAPKGTVVLDPEIRTLLGTGLRAPSGPRPRGHRRPLGKPPREAEKGIEEVRKGGMRGNMSLSELRVAEMLLSGEEPDGVYGIANARIVDHFMTFIEELGVGDQRGERVNTPVDPETISKNIARLITTDQHRIHGNNGSMGVICLPFQVSRNRADR